jgi:hypothetical protein
MTTSSESAGTTAPVIVLELTPAERDELLALVDTAARLEHDRYDRMRARPAGSHEPERIVAAGEYAVELLAIADKLRLS